MLRFCFSCQSIETKAHQSEGCRVRMHQHNLRLQFNKGSLLELWFQVSWIHACHYFHRSSWWITDTTDPQFDLCEIIFLGLLRTQPREVCMSDGVNLPGDCVNVLCQVLHRSPLDVIDKEQTMSKMSTHSSTHIHQRTEKWVSLRYNSV